MGYKYSPRVKVRCVLGQRMLSVHLFTQWDYIKSYSAPVLRKPSTKRPSTVYGGERELDKMFEGSLKDVESLRNKSKSLCITRTGTTWSQHEKITDT